MILAEGPHLSDDVTLLVDVGTNAEILLGNRDRLLAASSPTGPAFEGAQISSGQRAAPGAIERVRIDPETLEPRVKIVGCDAWSDEPGFDARVTGVCGSGIVEVVAELHLAGVLATDGTIDGSLADRSARVVPDGRTFSYVLWDGEPELRWPRLQDPRLLLASPHVAGYSLEAKLRATRMMHDALAHAWGVAPSWTGVEHLPRCPLDGLTTRARVLERVVDLRDDDARVRALEHQPATERARMCSL